MDDIEVDCADHKFQYNKGYLHPPYTGDVSRKHNSVEDQVDSGLGSLGYFSFDSNNYNQSLESTVSENAIIAREHEQVKESADVSPNLGSLETSISRLQISSCTSQNVDQCDSGLDNEKQRESLGLINSSGSSIDWVSPIFSPEQIMDIFRGDEDGDNHLHLSIIHGLPEVTMQIIGLAPDWDWLNQTNNLLQTPLHIAVITRQTLVVRRLMSAGASVDMRDQMGNTPLHNACRLGYEDVVRTLIRPVEYKECYQNKYDIPFQRLPQDLESMNYEGLTCFHLAAIGGHVDVMRLLLNAGANINAAEGKSGRTVLHLAADWGNVAMIKFLLSQLNTDINARTYAGLTPFLLAMGRRNNDVVDELLSKGALIEVLSLSEESDADISDEDMVEESVSNRQFRSFSQRGYSQPQRNSDVLGY